MLFALNTSQAVNGSHAVRAVYATAAPTVIPQGNTRRVMVVWVQLNYLQQLASVLFVLHVHSLLL